MRIISDGGLTQMGAELTSLTAALVSAGWVFTLQYHQTWTEEQLNLPGSSQREPSSPDEWLCSLPGSSLDC